MYKNQQYHNLSLAATWLQWNELLPNFQEHSSMSRFASVDNKFATSFDVVEEQLRSSTIGR